MLSWRLAFERSNKFAAVAPHIANLPVDPMNECPRQPARPINVVFMVGDADSLIPFAGGLVNNNPQAGLVRSSASTLEFFRDILGTGSSPIVTPMPDLNSNDNSTVTKYEYVSGSTKSKLTYYRVFGGGHSTPSISFPTMNIGAGSLNRDIETIHEFWNFFKTTHLRKLVFFSFDESTNQRFGIFAD